MHWNRKQFELNLFSILFSIFSLQLNENYDNLCLEFTSHLIKYSVNKRSIFSPLILFNDSEKWIVNFIEYLYAMIKNTWISIKNFFFQKSLYIILKICLSVWPPFFSALRHDANSRQVSLDPVWPEDCP
jgi:hypothetical protein